jgi:hypothetical protein
LLSGTATRTIESRGFCTPTGIALQKDGRYSVAYTLPRDWTDNGIPVMSSAGFNAFSAGLTRVQRAAFLIDVPFRRMWAANWFVPIARIGARGFDQYPLAQNTNTFTARKSGELFLFVNDAIAPIGPAGRGWGSYYPNNTGAATVTIARLP